MPLTAPLTVPYPYGQMPFVDPLQMAMFEQGMRVWAYSESATGSLTPPRFPGSGGSTGSLTTPQFPGSHRFSSIFSLDELNTRLSHSRSRIPPSEEGGLRASREPSTSGRNQTQARLDGELHRSPYLSKTLPRSSSARADFSSGSKTVAKTGRDYAPSASSRLTQPPATLPSKPTGNQSTEVVRPPPRSHTKSLPDQPTRSGQRRMTVIEGARRKEEHDCPALPLASLSTPKEGKRTLTSRSSAWSVTDKLRSRTVVS